ncbi:glycoside hydrolase family 36 protein [Cohnella zeiphila]|uniref:glycoside hydrolase family 36 protein n=1 Tax=Cohnella zeiphila TaxID=2761120 RepID=UPI0030805550
MLNVSTEKHTFALEGGDERFEKRLNVVQLQEGLDLIEIKVSAKQAAEPPVLALSWNHPVSDIHGCWHASADRNKGFRADWMRKLRSNLAASAPAVSFFNLNGQNRLTFAYSDALNTVQFMAGVHEESGEFRCRIELFTEAAGPIADYEASLLVDTRDLPYYDSLRNVGEWWAAMPEYAAAPVPDTAKMPMYSTWYSMHQNMTAARIEAQCRIAKEMGMEAVIVDDGWQTGDMNRGYAYCGDWEAYEGKFADMRGHVNAVHRLGMKFLLWYSVPYIGRFSRAWDRFKDKILRFNERIGAGVLDPRYPDVREYIISKYEQAVREWKLDGFKLDFIDQFYRPDDSIVSSADGRDYESIPLAVDRLLTDSIGRLRRLDPDIMVEFRQPYVGPAMRKYGNLFRASDCPNDSLQNRIRTLDIRLLCGDTAAHADMIMWNEGEPAESAALQFINILFSVPQISVNLDRIPPEHAEMLKFWLGFWKKNRSVLLGGDLAPRNPELLYPVVQADGDGRSILATYHDELLRYRNVPHTGELTLINGRLREGLYLELEEDLGEAKIEMYDCRGRIVRTESVAMKRDVHRLAVPPAGLAHIQFARKENAK